MDTLFFTYQKSASALDEAEGILNEIYSEAPHHWPHGLSKDHFDGGLYLVRKQASNEPVGFVGWQERLEGMDKVGYYSVGIRPQFRREGFAKQALSKLIKMKAAGVDRVQALVKDTNEPSQQLAQSLGVPVKMAALQTYLTR